MSSGCVFLDGETLVLKYCYELWYFLSHSIIIDLIFVYFRELGCFVCHWQKKMIWKTWNERKRKSERKIMKIHLFFLIFSQFSGSLNQDLKNEKNSYPLNNLKSSSIKSSSRRSSLWSQMNMYSRSPLSKETKQIDKMH